ncbi:MAG: DNA polymerase III subunit gamma/tau, partial [Neoaquamicrobium sediminum]
PQAAPEPEAEPQARIRSLADIAALADANRDKLFEINLKKYVRPVSIQDGHIEVALTQDAPKSLLNDLSVRLKEWTGRRWLITTSKEPGGQTLSEIATARRDAQFTDARNDPAVAAILSRFPGAKVIDVRIPDAPEDNDDETAEPMPDPGVGDEDDEL